jgi:hypothetical protein
MMKKMYALALASLLVAPVAALADEHESDGPGYGSVGCNPHPDFSDGFKNPGEMLRATRAAHDANPKQAADLGGYETVGDLLAATCVAPEA